MEANLNLIISEIVNQLFSLDADVELTRPDPQFGDFSTNIAMKLAGQIKKNPREIAEEIYNKLKDHKAISSVEIAGPGFINIKLKDDLLWNLANQDLPQIYQNQNWVIEYSCPNAFKELHTGHLYNTLLGDSIAKIFEAAGARVNRTSFGGDVGRHVARAMWGILQKLGGEHPLKLNDISKDPIERANFISQCYVNGASADKEDQAQEQILQLNKKIYQFHSGEIKKDDPLAVIYFTCRDWSFDYFKAFYAKLKVNQMHYYPESSVADLGISKVQEGLEAGIFKKSDGAIIFEGGENLNNHTRVFINSEGLPTYETKDVGVIFQEIEDYNFDQRLLLTGNDQKEYMQVVFTAVSQLDSKLKGLNHHLANGTVKFSDGKKMSSRLGNVTRAVDVLASVEEKVKLNNSDQNQIQVIQLGAIKYEFLKYRVGSDINFDVQESVSLNGNSGPYLQYAYARAMAIMRKADSTKQDLNLSIDGNSFDEEERLLVLKLSEWGEAFGKSAKEAMPHYIANYLYSLAQEFNRFYEKTRIIGDSRQQLRLSLVRKYANTLSLGLNLLGVEVVDRM
ncbi:MAG TPA: arginine--tRNA ligase [Candidatus Saccharibacteria bacterium]|nr:arginine--tRNA ligase [Candidatus Saccharibacteria bacterium]